MGEVGKEWNETMLLVDQVELLGQNMAQLRNQQFVLPLLGGISATSQTYCFKSLVHPARDIATTIAQADPAGNKLPDRLRGWNLSVTEGWNKAKTISLRKLLGMIIHVYYLNISDNRLDIANDLGKRIIVPYDLFLAFIERLILTPEDICLVVCSLAEERFNSKRAVQTLMSDVPGSGDVVHCLATIRKWPTLKEHIWKTFFVDHSTTVNTDSHIAKEVPFIKGGRHTGTTIMWEVGWRRDDLYATQWIDIFHLIYEIRDYFDNPVPKQ